MTVPGGIWAVASGLGAASEARSWARAARAAAAWTFRRPAGGDREALAALRALAAEAPWLAVHGRGDLARLAGARAVIAGLGSLPAWELRRLFAGLAIGRSTHAPEEVDRAARTGLDFVLFGPVWETPAKRGILAPRGLEGLAAACAAGVPVVAIGGVDRPERVAACRRAGARGAAVLRAARDPVLLGELVAAWDEDAQSQSTRPSS